MSATEAPEAPATLCYRQAYYRKKDGRITEKQYFHYLFQHLSGTEHKGDDEVRMELQTLDPLTGSINQWIVHGLIDYGPVEDTTPFEDVFDSFRNGSVDDVKAALEKVGDNYREQVRRSLAILALQERKAAVVKYLLDEGIEPYSDAFEDEVRRVQKKQDPETFQLLQDWAEKTKRPWSKKQPKHGHPLG